MSRKFYVLTGVKFTFSNKIEAMHERSLSARDYRRTLFSTNSLRYNRRAETSETKLLTTFVIVFAPFP